MLSLNHFLEDWTCYLLSVVSSSYSSFSKPLLFLSSCNCHICTLQQNSFGYWSANHLTLASCWTAERAISHNTQLTHNKQHGEFFRNNLFVNMNPAGKTCSNLIRKLLDRFAEFAYLVVQTVDHWQWIILECVFMHTFSMWITAGFEPIGMARYHSVLKNLSNNGFTFKC